MNMLDTVMYRNIIGQPQSLARVLAHQRGDGARDLQQAAGLLRQARRIVFTGMGSSLYACIPAAYLLEENGNAAEVVETSELLHFTSKSIRLGTVVVLVSRSGESVEAVKAMPRFMAQGAEVIVITNVADSQLARDGRHVLLLNSDADRMVAVQTYTGTVATLVLLAAAALHRSVDSEIFALSSALPRVIEESLAAANDWVSFLKGASCVYLLGRGPSLASVREGSLLFNESARVPSIAMSGAAFRHGVVEVAGPNLHAIVFAGHHGHRSLDHALAGDLQKLNANVRLVDNGSDRNPFGPILEIVPIQVAVCALAVANGIDPGDFRYATLVTATEEGF